MEARIVSPDEPGPIPPPEAADTTISWSASGPDGARIGPYHILQKLSEGGMGEVYEAEQEHPIRRRVALKLIKLGMDSKQILARFESERQALALMDHPSIARILDAGTTEQGRPYFAMEYVKGVSITEYCDTQRLNTRERLELFMQVCDGIQHAHQKGIIHRDLKPGNVMVTLQGETAVPKIIDFGIAKAIAQPLTERTLFTELGQLIGTPEYMSPEQAEMSGLDVDTRTDVYSLGVILYELLTGALPFDTRELMQSGFNEFRRKILEDEPPTPSTRLTSLGDGSRITAERRRTELPLLARQLRGDLDWITMKALEKARTRRYGSAAELAADIARYLTHEPVLASPPSNLYRLGKFVFRHKVAAGFAATVLIGLTGYALMMGVQAGRIARERDRANQQAEQARQERQGAEEVAAFLIKLFKVSNPGEAIGNTITAREILDRGAETIRQELKKQPLVRARLMNTIAEVYFNLGLEDRSRSLLLEALTIQPDSPDHPQPVVAASLTLLAHLKVGAGEYSEARRLYERALDIWRATEGPDHIQVAKALGNLANLLAMTGDWEAAYRLRARSVEIMEKALGPNHPDYAKSLHNLGALRMSTGDYAAARELFLRALEVEQRVFGPQHLEVAGTLNNLGDISAWAHDYAGARRYYKRALEIREKVFGDDHFEVAWSLSSLAMLSAREGDLASAGQLHRRALRIYQKTGKLEDPVVLYSEGCYAALTGAKQEALRDLRRAVLGPGFSGFILHDPNLASLRGDTAFQAIVAQVKERAGKPH